MDRKTKVFFWIMAIATAISIVLIYNRSFIAKDYEIREAVSKEVEI